MFVITKDKLGFLEENKMNLKEELQKLTRAAKVNKKWEGWKKDAIKKMKAFAKEGHTSCALVLPPKIGELIFAAQIMDWEKEIGMTLKFDKDLLAGKKYIVDWSE